MNKGFFSLEIQVTFERIKRVIVAAILIRGIRLFNRHIKCYMRNVTIRKTWKHVLSRNVSWTRSNFVDNIYVDMLEV